MLVRACMEHTYCMNCVYVSCTFGRIALTLGWNPRITNLHGHRKKNQEAPIVIEDDAWCMMHTDDYLFRFSVL